MSRENILKATDELIKVEGIEGVTTRKIAELAGTNVASINYYFGSKDKLINEVLRNHLISFRSAFDVLDKPEIPPLERLKMFLLTYASLLMEHPEIAKFLLSQERLFESHLQYAEFMKAQGSDKLIRTLVEIVGPNQDEIKFIIPQMFAAIFFPVIFNKSVNTVVRDVMLSEEQSHERLIDLFLGHYFYKYGE